MAAASQHARADWTGPEAMARYQKAADYSAANNGVSVLVMVGGQIVFERYEAPHSDLLGEIIRRKTRGESADPPWLSQGSDP